MSIFRNYSALLPHLALLLVNVIYSANYIIAKEVIPDYVKPFGMILIRVLFATLLYWLVNSLIVKENIKTFRDFFHLAICGFFGIALNQLMFFKGLATTTPINASLIMTTIPITVLIAAAILTKEMITFKKIIGIVLGITGAILLLTMGQDFSFDSSGWRGGLFIWINATSFSIFLVIVKPLMKKYHPFTIIKWTFTFGLLFVIPVGLPDLQYVHWNHIPTDIWVAMLFIVLFVTFIAYLLNTWALKYVDSSVVGIYIYLQPVFTAVIALIVAKDVLTLPKVLFSLLIFVGVYLVSDVGKFKWTSFNSKH